MNNKMNNEKYYNGFCPDCLWEGSTKKCKGKDDEAMCPKCFCEVWDVKDMDDNTKNEKFSIYISRKLHRFEVTLKKEKTPDAKIKGLRVNDWMIIGFTDDITRKAKDYYNK